MPNNTRFFIRIVFFRLMMNILNCLVKIIHTLKTFLTPYLTFCAQKQKRKLKRQKRGKTNNLQRFLSNKNPRHCNWNLVKYNQSYNQIEIVCCFLIKLITTPLDGKGLRWQYSSDILNFLANFILNILIKRILIKKACNICQCY